jgi:hypothetical protein
MTPASPITPVWPALIKHDGDDELSYVASFSSWETEPALCASPYQDTDILIDSKGQVFELYYDAIRKDVSLNPAHIAISLGRFSELVQLHLAHQQQCCVSKVIFRDYQQGFELVARTLDSS